MRLKRKTTAKDLVATIAILAGVSSLVWTRVSAATDPKSPFELFPDRIGSFKATARAIGVIDDTLPQLFGEHATRTYASQNGSRYEVSLASTKNDSQAFALLTRAKMIITPGPLQLNDVGTASFTTSQSVFFSKGTTFVEVSEIGKASFDDLKTLARQFAQTLDAGEGEIPVLVKHLPDWQTASQQAVYCVTLGGVQEATHFPGVPSIGLDINKEVKQPPTSQSQPVLDALSFDGGTESVVANYGPSKLLIVEFTTPQFAADNDQRIATKIQELKNQNQPVPTAYRRVGNYSVFVFNAPDEKTANDLIDQVKYEQTVQWLGDDPHLIERIERFLAQKTAGTVVAVLESSGLSLLLCVGIGGLCGTLLFRWRRARRQTEAYSDAGGMTRLNLDEIGTVRSPELEHDPQRERKRLDKSPLN